MKFISYKGYRQLLDNEQSDIIDAVKMILVIIFGICNLYSYENSTNVQLLIACIPDGKRKVGYYKFLASTMYVCMVWAVAFLPRLILIGIGYGYSHLSWNSTALTWFSYMPDIIPVWLAIILVQIIRICGGLITAMVISFLSSRISVIPITVIVAGVILLVPAITYFAGLTGAWGILPLVSGHAMIMS